MNTKLHPFPTTWKKYFKKILLSCKSIQGNANRINYKVIKEDDRRMSIKNLLKVCYNMGRIGNEWKRLFQLEIIFKFVRMLRNFFIKWKN